MYFLKFFMFAPVLFALLLSAEAKAMTFNCSNAPSQVWGEYYMISATTSDFSELQVNVFGLVEGSIAAEEEEPVEIVGEFISKPNLAAKASSSRWKNATPFDLTTEELGSATLYLHTTEFGGVLEEPIVRLKVGGKDLRLTCRYTP